MGQFNCPQVGTLPDDYSKKLPKLVSAAERPATSLFPFQSPGPADVTWYFPIGLDKTNPTGVFFPPGFSFAKEIDVILFFHGNKQGLWENINEYWRGNVANIRLRENVVDSGRNVVLVAPTMGAVPGHGGVRTSEIGIFAQDGGGMCFLDHVATWLAKYEPRYADKNITPQVRKVVLAAHSGGGNAIHAQMESMKSKLCAIWGFDIVLGGADDWINFALLNPGITLTFFHSVQNTDDFNSIVAKKKEIESKGRQIPNLTTFDVGGAHYAVLTNNFPTQMKNTGCFAGR
jgi:hypothetical protein